MSEIVLKTGRRRTTIPRKTIRRAVREVYAASLAPATPFRSARPALRRGRSSGTREGIAKKAG